MSYRDYEAAQKAGIKAFKTALSKGTNEYLPVLDEIIKDVEIVGEVNLGLVQIPLDRVVGTSTQGRTFAFASNFMPILDYNTEFGAKWSTLCDSQIEEGIHEPIKVYEYMNYFYVIEGNKRVSVLKYFEAVTVPAQVMRKIPARTDDLQNKIYYEFMDFYKLTEINYVWFSQEGCFQRLLELTCKDPTLPWTGEQKQDFGSFNHNFNMALRSKGGEKLPMLGSDALLIFIDIYGYDEVKNLTEAELKEKIGPLWEEFEIESNGRELTLSMEPSAVPHKKFMDYFISPKAKSVVVGFIYDKNPKESDWLYAHELGRLHLEEKNPEKIRTLMTSGLYSDEAITAAIDAQIKEGAKIVFTTSSRMEAVSLKAAANHPDTVIMNCSLDVKHKVMRTYYARLYEVKFLAGMIAGSLSRTGKIGYLADYPIVGMPADINAFALGARMMNPAATVYLEWTSVKGVVRELAIEHFKEKGVQYVSDQVMIKPVNENRLFGLYNIDAEEPVNLAMPVYQWGVFYERLIDGVLNGTFKQDDKESEDKAINYWWGLSAGVVDIILSNKIPAGTKRIVNTVKDLIIEGKFAPFDTVFRSQDGLIRNDEDTKLSPAEIMEMNYLLDNVIGEIPEIDELYDRAKPIVALKGVEEES